MLPALDPYAATPEQDSFQLMLSVAESLLSDIFRLGNSPVTDGTLASLKGIHTKALDFSESIVARRSTLESLSDFENALEELADAITKLDAACDAFDLADGGPLLTRLSLSDDHVETHVPVPWKPEAATENEIGSYQGFSTLW
jgi:hypothetical protein